jgi:hypothetical protein
MGVTAIWTQSLVFARQALYNFSRAARPHFSLIIFWGRASHVCPRPSVDFDPHTYASLVTGMTGIGHRAQHIDKDGIIANFQLGLALNCDFRLQSTCDYRCMLPCTTKY